MTTATYAREQDLLGWMMTQQSLPEHITALKADWFSDRLHGQIFEAITELISGNDIAVPSDVCDLLNARHPLQRAEQDQRHDYVWDLVNHSSVTNHKHIAKAIAENGRRVEMRRALLGALNEMDGHDSYDQAVTAALGKIDSVALKGVTKGLVTAHDLNLMGVQWLHECNERQGELPGLPTGFTDLDDVVFGLKPGELVTIAGATAMGKTTFASNIAEHVAMGWIRADGTKMPGRNVLVVSREMGETQIALRHFASQGHLSLSALQRGTLTGEQFDALAAATAQIDGMKVFYDLTSVTPNEIALRARQLKRKEGSIGLIVVDHIGLLRSDAKRRAKFEEVADITWALKNLARDMNIPIIQLAQVSRDVKNRADKRPTLSDLSDSSSIEKDSDVVIAMYRDDYYNPGSGCSGMAEAIVLKNRMGECRTIPLVFKGEFNKFLPCDAASHMAARQAEASGGRGKGNPRQSGFR